MAYINPLAQGLESEAPAGGAGGFAMPGWGLPAAYLGSAVGGAVFDALGRRKAAKRQHAQQERILNSIDTGASQAKLAISQQAGAAQGGLLQSQINQGTVNSSLAPGQAAGLAMQAGGQMGAIEQDRAKARAEAISAFSAMPASVGSQSLEGAGNALGLILASRGAQGGSGTTDAIGGSGVAQATARTPAIDQSGGDPALSSGSFKPAYGTPGAGGDTPVTAMVNPLGVQNAQSQMARYSPLMTAANTRARRRSPGLGTVGAATYA